jgi:hypothetical protein
MNMDTKKGEIKFMFAKNVATQQINPKLITCTSNVIIPIVQLWLNFMIKDTSSLMTQTFRLKNEINLFSHWIKLF